MKIRNKLLLKVMGFFAACAIRAWVSTLRYRYRPLGPNVEPQKIAGGDDRYIYIAWHENLLLPAHWYAHPTVSVMISRHADGELISTAVRLLGFRTVRGGKMRGSETRGGIEATRKMLKLSKKSHLGVTPDGPRGPRREMQMGPIYLAARTGLPIIAVGVGYHKPWRMRSWDRFCLPRPWSQAALVTSEPIYVPPDLGPAQMEEYRERVEQVLNETTEIAQHWADYGMDRPTNRLEKQEAPTRDLWNVLHGRSTNGNGHVAAGKGPRGH